MLEPDLSGRPRSLPGAGQFTAEHSALDRARKYLWEHYAEPVSLARLVDVTGLSRFHLVHLFTRHTGLPPHAYQIHIRIERACALLELGVPAVEVASLVGFADQSHFTRHFRRIWRVTPGHYLRMVGAKIPQAGTLRSRLDAGPAAAKPQ